MAGPYTDLWALGVMALELFVGKNFINFDNPRDVLDALVHGSYKLPSGLDDDVADFITQLTKLNPNERLGFTEEGMPKLRKHPLFRDYNWNEKKIPFSKDIITWFEENKPEVLKMDEEHFKSISVIKKGRFGDIRLVERNGRKYVVKEMNRAAITMAKMNFNIKNSRRCMEELYKCP